MTRITLLDVSRHAGVSKSTASLVLNDSPTIPEATKTRVRQAIEELGYVYNRQAATLRNQRSMAIGLIATEIENPYFAKIVMAFEDQISSNDYTMLVGYSRDDVDRQTKLISTFLERGVDGMVILPANGTDPDEMTAMLQPVGIPIVLIARYEGALFKHVGTDNLAAGRLLGAHLADLGVRSVAWLGGRPGNSTFEDRFRGLEESMRERNALSAPIVSIFGNSNPAEGARATAEMLDRGHMPDAIVAFSDVYAGGVYSELHGRGVQPGLDVAVAGFDDSRDSTHQIPPLTSVATFPDKIGSTSAELMMRTIVTARGASQDSAETRRVLIEPQLRIRASTMSWRPRA